MTPSARPPNAIELHVALQQFCSPPRDRVDIQPGQFGQPAIAAMSEAQRLQAGIEPALPLVERYSGTG